MKPEGEERCTEGRMSFKEEEEEEPAAVPNAANRPTKMKNEQDHRN